MYFLSTVIELSSTIDVPRISRYQAMLKIPISRYQLSRDISTRTKALILVNFTSTTGRVI